MTIATKAAETDVVDLNCVDPARNMYGCLPCPACSSEYRAAYKTGPDAGLVVCDDCGRKAPVVWLQAPRD